MENEMNVGKKMSTIKVRERMITINKNEIKVGEGVVQDVGQAGKLSSRSRDWEGDRVVCQRGFSLL